MKIKIEQQSPDGVNISIEHLIVDTIEEANEFTKWITKIWGAKKINQGECMKLLRKVEKR